MAQTVLSKLPELRTIGARHVSYLEWFRLNWHMLKLPPLFAEIFDIPKCEEDLHQGWIIIFLFYCYRFFFYIFTYKVSFFFLFETNQILPQQTKCVYNQKQKNVLVMIIFNNIFVKIILILTINIVNALQPPPKRYAWTPQILVRSAQKYNIIIDVVSIKIQRYNIYLL